MQDQTDVTVVMPSREVVRVPANTTLASLLADEPNLLAACFIYALGTIVGVVSPGGLGVTEGSMLGMLQSSTIMGAARLAKGSAAAATLIIRIATLWFAVLVGAVVLLLFQGRFGDAARELDEELAKGE